MSIHKIKKQIFSNELFFIILFKIRMTNLHNKNIALKIHFHFLVWYSKSSQLVNNVSKLFPSWQQQ